MFPTIELRWFCEGAAPPAGVREWFRTLGRAEIQQPRVDYYLHLADEPALGIKVREGRLEIKKRTRAYGAATIRPGVGGVIEGWRKWSFELARVEAGRDIGIDDGSPWLPVLKARKLLRFAVIGDRHFLLRVQVRPERGCEVELTSVSVGANRRWTVGLEAFGAHSATMGDLLAVASRIFEAETAPSLTVPDSYGYPAWLGRLSRFEEKQARA